MKVRAVDFICYWSKDYQKDKEFYTQVLGLTVTQEWEGMFAEFDLGNATLAIGSAEAMGEKIETPQGNATVALAVEDLEAVMEELKAKGIETSDMQDFPDQCKMTTISDPSGNKIMLHQRKDGTAG